MIISVNIVNEHCILNYKNVVNHSVLSKSFKAAPNTKLKLYWKKLERVAFLDSKI